MTNTGVTRPLFICGIARSGTTLLLRLLDGHPELSVIPDETYAYAALDRRNASGALFRLSQYSPIRRSRDWLARLALLTTARELRPDWKTILENHNAIMTGLHSGKKIYWVEKSPSNERLVPLLDAEFGCTAAYIHIVRDPRDVVASWLLRRRPDPPERQAMIQRVRRHWAHSARLAGRNCVRCGERYRIVLFEHLVQSPEPVITRLAAWLGITMDPALLVATRNGTPQPINSSHPKHVADGVISSAPVGRFPAVLTPQESRTIEIHLEKYMRRFGYLAESRVPTGLDH